MKISVDEISKALNIGKSTVYKALHNCQSVNYGKKQIIREYLERTKNSVDISCKKIDIGVLLPVNPVYFWSGAKKGVERTLAESGCSYVFSYYSNLENNEDAYHSFEYLRQFDPDIIIAVFPNDPKIFESINEVAERKPVILLTENFYQNAFSGKVAFVGEDAYKNGGKLAELYINNYSKKYVDVLIIETDLKSISPIRKNGFLNGIKNKGINISGTITIQPQYAYASSLIAREINTKYRDKFNCIYCVDGIMEKVCLAVKKLKLSDSILCIGHEKPRSIDRYIAEGLPIACIEQDVFSQGVKAAGLAADYIKNKILPPKINFYIDSKSHICNA